MSVGVMEASVVVRLVDDVTAPGRKLSASVREITKEVKALKSALGGGKLNFAREFGAIAKQARAAASAVSSLRSDLGKPVRTGYMSAAQGIGRVKREAEQATNAVRGLNRALGRSGGGMRSSGGGSHGGGGGGRSGGSHGGGHGWGGHYGAHAARHIGRHIAGTAGGMAFSALGGEIVEGIGSAIRAGIEQSFEKNHTMAMLQMQGESVGDINKAVAVASRMARDIPQFTTAQHLEAIAELRPALTGGFKEAMSLAPLFQEAVGVLESVKTGAGGKAFAGIDSHGEALDLVRALEIKGETSRFGNDDEKNNANMKAYINGMTKAIVAFNGQINSGDFHSAFKFSKFGASTWSLPFATEILPTLMNEMKNSPLAKASSTGTALKSMYQTIVGNVMTGPAMDAWYKMGMFDKSQLDFKKDGHVKGVKTGEHMKGWSLFQEDPYRFVQDIALPAMKDHGIDIGNAKAVQAEMKALFGNRNAEFIADVLALQKTMIEKDRENVKKAMGIDGRKFLENSDSTTRMQVFAAAFKELGGAIGDLTLSGNMRGLKGLIDWAHSASDAVKDSSYGKKLGGYYDSLIAGMFGQSLGRKGMAARNGEYYGAGKILGSGWSHFMSSSGKMLKFWEDVGVFSGSVKLAGKALDGLGSASDVTRSALEGMRSAIDSKFVQSIFQPFQDYINRIFGPDPSYKQAKNDLKTATAKPVIPDVKKDAEKVLPKIPPMLTRKQAEALTPVKAGGGAGSAVSAAKSIYAEIAIAAASAMPGIERSGITSAAALAAGIQSGGGQAAAAMSGLMSSLASIASGGVVVPVKLDTAAAEAQLSQFVSKSMTPSLKGGARPQFSKSLNDTGQ